MTRKQDGAPRIGEKQDDPMSPSTARHEIDETAPSASPPGPSDDAIAKTALEVIDRWRGLSSAQARTAELLAAEVKSVSDMVEDSTVTLSRQFLDLTALIRDRSDRIVGSADAIETDVGPADSLDGIVRHVDRLATAIDDVAQINRQIHLLAIDTAIEGLHTKGGDRILTAVADMRELSKAVNQTTEAMRLRIGMVGRDLHDCRQTLREAAMRDTDERTMATARSDAPGDALRYQNETVGVALSETAEESRRAEDILADMVYGIQFQDRTSQRLQHVADTLKIVGAALESMERNAVDRLPGMLSPRPDVDIDWLHGIVSRYTLGEVRERFVEKLLLDGVVPDAETLGIDTEDDPGGLREGDIELF